MDDRLKELGRNHRLRVAPALPAEETLLGVAPLRRGEGLPAPPKHLRPTVFEGHRNRCGLVLRSLEFVRRLLDWEPGGLTTGDAAVREQYKSKKKALFGDWDSIAGRLAGSLVPRSRVTVEALMAVTDRNLYVLWVEAYLPRRGEPLPPVVGWHTDRQNLQWVRHRRDRSKGTYELGFTDGSWARVELDGEREEAAAMFPNPLHYKDPVP